MRAFIERLLAPGYGTCLKCKRPWKYVEEHNTIYKEIEGCISYGMFPLCETCWKELEIPQNRLPYYKKQWNSWNRDNHKEATWKDVENAVLNEK